MFKKMPKTVAEVMAGFHKQVEQLGMIIYQQEQQRQIAEADIAEAEARRNAAEAEIAAAVGARTRIKALLGEAEEPVGANVVTMNANKEAA